MESWHGTDGESELSLWAKELQFVPKKTAIYGQKGMVKWPNISIGVNFELFLRHLTYVCASVIVGIDANTHACPHRGNNLSKARIRLST